MKDNFEESLKRLEEIVNILEQGNIPLEESITLFEEGLKLSKKCSEKITKIEEKVQIILGKENNNLILEDFQKD